MVYICILRSYCLFVWVFEKGIEGFCFLYRFWGVWSLEGETGMVYGDWGGCFEGGEG